jgi:hypothetical protein
MPGGPFDRSSGELDQAIGEIARRLAAQGKIGEENRKLSRRDELRFGTNGSLSVNISGPERGKWYDHETKIGGGSWKLVQEKAGVSDVREWLVREGFIREPDTKRKREADKHWGNGSNGAGNQPGLGDILKTYDYVDEQGLLLFQVVRFAGHKFLQRRPDDKGGWIWKLGDTRRVLYRLPEVLAAKAARNGHPWRVYLCEGEKDVDRLRDQWGVVATTNPGGAGNWLSEFDSLFAGSETILLEDNDKAGRDRTAKLAPGLTQAGASVKVIRFPDLDEGSDVSDWLDDGLSQPDIETLIEDIEPYAGAVAWIDPQTLTLAYWLERDIAPPDFLLGELLSTTSRVLMVAPTGIGKTNIALAIALAIAEGCDFLHWRAHRAARVLYIDGEMPRRLMKQRLVDAVRRQGVAPTNLFILSREDHPDMPSLDTVAGQEYIDAVIKLLCGVDFVIFDNIQALMEPGDDFGAASWQHTLSWVRDLSRRKIGQLWVHHTGHNEAQSYGTKTREWQLDTVMLLERLDRDSDIAFNLNFPKARERTPGNRSDFQPAVITLAKDEWNYESGGRSGTSGRGRLKLEEIALRALDEALAKGGDTPRNHPKIPPDTLCVTAEMWQRYFEQVQIGDAKPESVARTFRKYAAQLQVAGKVGSAKPWVWRTT